MPRTSDLSLHPACEQHAVPGFAKGGEGKGEGSRHASFLRLWPLLHISCMP